MSQSDPDTLTRDEVYDLLSNARRRFVISYLRKHDGKATLNELSQEVAAWENDVPTEDLSDQQVKRAYVSLYQTHLPKLDDAGIVEYDREEGDVQLTGTVAELDTYLPERRQQTESRPWMTVYAALAIAGLLLYAATMLLPALPLSPSMVGIATIVAFAATTLAHYLEGSRE